MGALRDGEQPQALSAETVRRIAELAALELSDDEVDRLARELASILGHFEALRGAEGAESAEGFTAEGAESAEGLVRGVRLRADEPAADALEGDPGASAPGWRAGFFVVPRVSGIETADSVDRADSADSSGSERYSDSPEVPRDHE